jgi:hypothetical protein
LQHSYFQEANHHPKMGGIHNDNSNHISRSSGWHSLGQSMEEGTRKPTRNVRRAWNQMPHLPRPQQPECDGRYGGDTRYGEISGIAAIRRRPEGDAGGRPAGRYNANVGRVHSITGEQFEPERTQISQETRL